MNREIALSDQMAHRSALANTRANEDERNDSLDFAEAIMFHGSRGMFEDFLANLIHEEDFIIHSPSLLAWRVTSIAPSILKAAGIKSTNN